MVTGGQHFGTAPLLPTGYVSGLQPLVVTCLSLFAGASAAVTGEIYRATAPECGTVAEAWPTPQAEAQLEAQAVWAVPEARQARTRVLLAPPSVARSNLQRLWQGPNRSFAHAITLLLLLLLLLLHGKLPLLTTIILIISNASFAHAPTTRHTRSRLHIHLLSSTSTLGSASTTPSAPSASPQTLHTNIASSRAKLSPSLFTQKSKSSAALRYLSFRVTITIAITITAIAVCFCGISHFTTIAHQTSLVTCSHNSALPASSAIFYLVPARASTITATLSTHSSLARSIHRPLTCFFPFHSSYTSRLDYSTSSGSSPDLEPPPRNPRRLQQLRYQTAFAPTRSSSLYSADESDPDDDASPTTIRLGVAALDMAQPLAIQPVSPPSSPEIKAWRTR